MNSDVQKERKKIVKILILIIIFLIGCLGMYLLYDNFNNHNNNQTINQFKEEYEALNNKERANDPGNNHLSISIDNDNPIKYASIDEIIDTIQNKTGIIYLGYPDCPWCRNAVPVLLSAAKNAEVKEILYLNIHDIRDKYEIVNGELKQTNPGDEKYQELLSALDSVLDNYIVTDENGTEYQTGEKRLFAPTVLFIKDGEIVGYHVGTVSLKEGQTKYDRLDKDQQEELENIYLDYIEAVYQEYCDDAC